MLVGSEDDLGAELKLRAMGGKVTQPTRRTSSSLRDNGLPKVSCNRPKAIATMLQLTKE
jgi:hypothetical protein